MTEDLRKKRSESAEGHGLARRAWDRYMEEAHRLSAPLQKSAVQRLTARWTAEMLGFWLAWHLHGGFEGLEESGWHRATIYRKLRKFRTLFKMHPDEYKIQGVTVDPVLFWDIYLKGKGNSR